MLLDAQFISFQLLFDKVFGLGWGASEVDANDPSLVPSGTFLFLPELEGVTISVTNSPLPAILLRRGVRVVGIERSDRKFYIWNGNAGRGADPFSNTENHFDYFLSAEVSAMNTFRSLAERFLSAEMPTNESYPRGQI